MDDRKEAPLTPRRGTINPDSSKLKGAVYMPPMNQQPSSQPEFNYRFLIEEELRKVTSRKIDWRQIADIIFMLVLFIGGTILITFSNTGLSLENTGGVIYGAGFIPSVMAAWALFTGAPSYRKYNAIKVATGGILTVIGIILLASSGQESMNVIGTSMCEVGTLFVISRLFFLAEDSEREIEKLQKQLKEARQATGAGLALSYFYNFLQRMVKDLSDLSNNNDKNGEESKLGKKIIKLTLDKSDKENGIQEFYLQEPIMTIFMPRTLNEINMNDKLKTLGKEGCFKYYSGYRAMSVNFLKFWESNEDGTKCVSGMCCMPTVVSSIYRRFVCLFVCFFSYLFGEVVDHPILGGLCA